MSTADTDRDLRARELVGARLRQLRQACKLTQDAAAEAVDGSKSKISRMEAGLVPFRRRDLLDLLALYGVADPYQQETIISVALGHREPGWWDGQDIPLEETVVWSHEHAANLIRTYQPILVPELLRTEEYARAAHQASHYPPPPMHTTDSSVKNLALRQETLFARDDRRPNLWAIIEEPVLWRPLRGDVGAHLRQLDALDAACQTRSITIQINPMDSPFVPVTRPFSIFRFPDRPQVIAVHGPAGDEINDLQANEQQGRLYEQLMSVAQPRADTPRTLARIRDHLSTHA